MKIAIIGKGNVGSALEAGLVRNGHEVRTVGRDPDASSAVMVIATRERTTAVYATELRAVPGVDAVLRRLRARQRES